MEEVKDLSELLAKAKAKDKYFKIDGKFNKLLSPQNQAYRRPFTYKTDGWGSIERVETNTDGTEKDKRTPTTKGRIRAGVMAIKTTGCWSFRTLNGKLLLPWDSPFGVFKSSLIRSLKAQMQKKYETEPLNLIKVYPSWLEVGDAPCESMKEGMLPQIVMEQRNTQKGKVMVEAFYDYIEDRHFSCIIKVDGESPIDDASLVAMIKTLDTLDNIGASKRGAMTIGKISQVKLSAEEIELLEQGKMP